MPYTSSTAYKRYAIVTLTAVYALNLVDRGLMMLLLQPIKEDLHLSDTQMGSLTGIIFGLFYATLGLPVARWADRGNRVSIAALAIGLWGITVMMCLFVGNFVQLAFARFAAAVGEAGCKPPTYSLVGDYFPGAAERTRAMAIYWLGSPIAGLVSFVIGGWLCERYGWRMTFFLMGIPGLLLAVLVKLTIVEPRLRNTSAEERDEIRRALPPLRTVFSTLWERKSCRHIGAALVLFYTMGLGLAPWQGAFLMRTHGMSASELGIWFGLIFGLGGIAGIVLGGQVASRLFVDDERGQMRLTAVATALLLPCYLAFLLLPQRLHALLAFIPLTLVFNFFLAPTYALLQRLVPDDMRATAMAVVMLFANLIGMGIGPQVVGIMSDRLAPSLGVDSLRYAMLAMSFVAVWAAYHYWKVGETVKGDL